MEGEGGVCERESEREREGSVMTARLRHDREGCQCRPLMISKEL